MQTIHYWWTELVCYTSFYFLLEAGDRELTRKLTKLAPKLISGLWVLQREKRMKQMGPSHQLWAALECVLRRFPWKGQMPPMCTCQWARPQIIHRVDNHGATACLRCFNIIVISDIIYILNYRLSAHQHNTILYYTDIWILTLIQQCGSSLNCWQHSTLSPFKFKHHFYFCCCCCCRCACYIP